MESLKILETSPKQAKKPNSIEKWWWLLFENVAKHLLTTLNWDFLCDLNSLEWARHSARFRRPTSLFLRIYVDCPAQCPVTKI